MKEMFDKLSNRDTMKESIAGCSVALVGFTVQGNRHKASFAASGTFVEMASKKGILTARHVIEKILDESPYLGLSIQSKEHHFMIPREYVHVVEAPKRNERARGPDLAFVLLLSQEKLDFIEAHKYFLNLDKRRKRILSESLQIGLGFWTLSGHPVAYSTSEPSASECADIKDFRNVVSIGGVEREYTESGFDYMETVVDHASGGGIPKNLGGLSGGGFWHVPVHRLKDGQTRADEPILQGVAFWQTGVNQGKSTVICHGRRSIYGVLYDLVAQKYSH